MSFTAFNSSEIAAGKPTKQDLFQKVKDDFDDHETRIAALETSVVGNPPILFELIGEYWRGTIPQTNVMIYRVTENITLTAARLQIKLAGTSGTTQLDIQYKRAAAAYATVFTTQPSVAFGAGDLGLSTNAVFLVTSLLVGDILRLDITSAQTDSDSAILALEYTKT